MQSLGNVSKNNQRQVRALVDYVGTYFAHHL